MEKYKAAYSWARVAEHVGHGVTVNQCVDKWRRIKHKGTEEKPWTAEEVSTHV